MPPPPTEIPLKPSESDSDEEDSDVPKAAPKKQKPTGIIFRPVDPSPSPSSTVVNSPPPSTSSSSISIPVEVPSTTSTSTKISKFFVNPPPPQKPRRSVPKLQRPRSISAPPSTSISVSSSPSPSTSPLFSNFIHFSKPSPLLVSRLQHPEVFPQFIRFLSPPSLGTDTLALMQFFTYFESIGRLSSAPVHTLVNWVSHFSGHSSSCTNPTCTKARRHSPS